MFIFFTDMTQSYIGKGPLSRMRRSIRYRTGPKQSNPMSKPTACVHVKLKSDKMALMVETRLMAIHNEKIESIIYEQNTLKWCKTIC